MGFQEWTQPEAGGLDSTPLFHTHCLLEWLTQEAPCLCLCEKEDPLAGRSDSRL